MGSRVIRRKYWLSLILGVIIAMGLILPASAQLNAPAESQDNSSPAPLPDAIAVPKPAVSRLVPEQWVLDLGVIDAAPIYLDGRIIFRVTAPTVPGQQPAEERAQEIQRRLNHLTQQLTPSNDIAVSVDEASNLPVINANGQLLTTVTYLDARLSGYAEPSSLAFALAGNLRQAFDRYLIERSEAFLHRQIKILIGIVIGTALLQLGSRRVIRNLKCRQTRLLETHNVLGSDHPPNKVVETPSTLRVNNLADQVKARLDNRQKRKLNETALDIIRLFQPLLWMSSLLWMLNLFPYSRWITTLLINWLKIPARIFLLIGLTYIAVQLSGLVIDKASLALQVGTRWAPEQSQRLNLRFTTLSQVTKGVAGTLILGVAVLLLLSVAGIQIGPLLAGAGIVGIGVSLAAQSLIKDLINGFLILFEDHFGVGDVVSIEGIAGTVESVNLRITQLRDSEGKLITIPNSQIGIVQNLSMDWAQVDLQVTVSPHSDLNQVLTLLKTTATDLAQDEAWKSSILEPPDLLGVEALDYSGITLRLFLKTQPLEQWPVARELRRRIREAFEAEGIHMGLSPEQVSVRWEE